MKERYLITEMRKQANRMSFGEVCIHYSKCNLYSDLPPRCNLAAVEIGQGEDLVYCITCVMMGRH